MLRRVAFAMLLVLSLGSVAPVIAQDATPVAGDSLLAALGYPDLEVTATDDGLDFPAEVEAGRYHLTFTNNSSRFAEAQVFNVPEGMTFDEMEALLLELSDSEEIPDIFFELVLKGGIGAEPGEAGHVVLDLEPGEWVMTYFAFDDETGEEFDIPHLLTVTGEMPELDDPDVDVTVAMYEMDFTISQPVNTGPQIWQLTTVGAQPHFIFLTRYPEPVTEDQVMALLEALFSDIGPGDPEGEGTPVVDLGASMAATPDMAGMDHDMATPEGDMLQFELFEDVFGSSVLSMGQTNWVELDLEPGYYVALCFISDRESGVPHALMGMIEIFEVG